MNSLPVALIGAGKIGAFHAETLARRLPGVRLALVADPDAAAAQRLLKHLGDPAVRYEPDPRRAVADPAVGAVVIAAPGAAHADLIVAAAEAGRPIFCEKPIAYTLADADRACAAAVRAGVPLQIGFQRRFDRGYRRAKAAVADGSLGAVHLLRSITRDPELTHPERVPPFAIFCETLIHDFDVLRWLAGSEPVELFAMADALVAPAYRSAGLLDTAVVTLRFASGALATADASFQAVYGYDVRAEVFGAEGMVTLGEGRVDHAWHFGRGGVSRPQVNWFLDLFGEAYIAELAHFVECVRAGRQPEVTGADGRASLQMALAAIESVQTGRPVRIEAMG